MLSVLNEFQSTCIISVYMGVLWKECDHATMIYLIWRLYNLRMKESDSAMAHLYAYDKIANLSSQVMIIDKELCVLMLINTFPPSWEAFVTMVHAMCLQRE